LNNNILRTNFSQTDKNPCTPETTKCRYKKLKKTLINEKIFCVHGLKDNTKMSTLPKLTYRFNVVSVCFPTMPVAKIEKRIPKFKWNFKRPQIVKKVWRRTESEFSHFPISKFTTKYSNPNSAILL